MVSTETNFTETYWIKAGDRAFAEQQLDQSILYYNKAIEDSQNNVVAYLKRARAYKANGQFVKSAEDMATAYRLDPIYFESHMKSRDGAKRIFEEYPSPNFKQQSQ